MDIVRRGMATLEDCRDPPAMTAIRKAIGLILWKFLDAARSPRCDDLSPEQRAATVRSEMKEWEHREFARREAERAASRERTARERAENRVVAVWNAERAGPLCEVLGDSPYIITTANAEQVIFEGRVRLNGAVTQEKRIIVRPGDHIAVHAFPIADDAQLPCPDHHEAVREDAHSRPSPEAGSSVGQSEWLPRS